MVEGAAGEAVGGATEGAAGEAAGEATGGATDTGTAVGAFRCFFALVTQYRPLDPQNSTTLLPKAVASFPTLRHTHN